MAEHILVHVDINLRAGHHDRADTTAPGKRYSSTSTRPGRADPPSMEPGVNPHQFAQSSGGFDALN